MKTLKFAFALIMFLNLGNLLRLESQLLIPIILNSPSLLEKKMEVFGIKNHVARTIIFASNQYLISPEFIVALTASESNFNEKAISSKGYKGLLQIPQSVPADANILIGARIFREKMRITNNDVIKALCLYKGYPIGSTRGIQQANKVMRLFREIKGVKV